MPTAQLSGKRSLSLSMSKIQTRNVLLSLERAFTDVRSKHDVTRTPQDSMYSRKLSGVYMASILPMRYTDFLTYSVFEAFSVAVLEWPIISGRFLAPVTDGAPTPVE